MSVVGARPNFMKIAPFVHALEAQNRLPASERGAAIDHILVHTGQHYDAEMYHRFFEALDIPVPDIDLGVGSGSHAEQVGRTMIELERVIIDYEPDWVVVVGDVNATCSGAITARKYHVRVAHIEAGLRSFDQSMPEEINRLVTDSISNLLFTPDEFADSNLRREGHPDEAISFVGNIMIDTMEKHRGRASELDVAAILEGHKVEGQDVTDIEGLADSPHAVMTLHRPSNVDRKEVLELLVDFLADELADELPLIWSIHPRTRKNLEKFGLWHHLLKNKTVFLVNPVGYHEMMRLNMNARVMLTDSGGLQEECCVLGTPCVTLRDNTERPITLTEHGGVSLLAGNDPQRIRKALDTLLSVSPHAFRPPLWDGKTAERIVRRISFSS